MKIIYDYTILESNAISRIKQQIYANQLEMLKAYERGMSVDPFLKIEQELISMLVDIQKLKVPKYILTEEEFKKFVGNKSTS